MSADNVNLLIAIGTLVVIGVPLLILYRMMRFRKMLRECIAEKFEGKHSPGRWLIPVCEAVEPRAFADEWQALYPHSGEIFFEPAVYEPAVYEVEIEGVCACHYQGSLRDYTQHSDALYAAPEGRYTRLHRELKINGRELALHENHERRLETYHTFFKIIERDRGRHYYKLRVDGTGERLALSFGRPRPQLVHPKLGFLKARATLLPEGTPTVAVQIERDQELERAREKAARAARELANAVQTLSIRAQVMKNWGDPEFCSRFARAHCDELIKSQSAIREEAIGFLSQHELVAYLRKHNPSAVKTILGRLEALLSAERIALDRAIAAAEAPPPVAPEMPEELPPPPKKKLTAADVQQLKVRRQQIALGDRVALAKDRIATKQEIKAYVKAQYPDLDEDERQAMFQEILDQVDEEEHHGTTL